MFVNKSDSNEITRESLDMYLKEFAKVFRKLNGNKTPAEIILVGGASVLTNYDFRKSTGDIDAIILTSSVIKDAINIISERFNLPNDWLNAGRPDRSEERWQTLGMVGKVLFVVYTERGENRRIISARIAEKHERRSYNGYYQIDGMGWSKTT